MATRCTICDYCSSAPSLFQVIETPSNGLMKGEDPPICMVCYTHIEANRYEDDPYKEVEEIKEY